MKYLIGSFGASTWSSRSCEKRMCRGNGRQRACARVHGLVASSASIPSPRKIPVKAWDLISGAKENGMGLHSTQYWHAGRSLSLRWAPYQLKHHVNLRLTTASHHTTIPAIEPAVHCPVDPRHAPTAAKWVIPLRHLHPHPLTNAARFPRVAWWPSHPIEGNLGSPKGPKQCFSLPHLENNT
jgi:hypothetical protein